MYEYRVLRLSILSNICTGIRLTVTRYINWRGTTYCTIGQEVYFTHACMVGFDLLPGTWYLVPSVVAMRIFCLLLSHRYEFRRILW